MSRPSTMRWLISELQRRRVFRTAALYIVGAWLAMQVADVVLPALDIPESSIRYLLIALLLGFRLLWCSGGCSTSVLKASTGPDPLVTPPASCVNYDAATM